MHSHAQSDATAPDEPQNRSQSPGEQQAELATLAAAGYLNVYRSGLVFNQYNRGRRHESFRAWNAWASLPDSNRDLVIRSLAESGYVGRMIHRLALDWKLTEHQAYARRRSLERVGKRAANDPSWIKVAPLADPARES